MYKTLSPTYLKRKLIQNEILKETYLVESDGPNALILYLLPLRLGHCAVFLAHLFHHHLFFPFSMVFTISYNANNAMYLLFKFPHELPTRANFRSTLCSACCSCSSVKCCSLTCFSVLFQLTLHRLFLSLFMWSMDLGCLGNARDYFHSYSLSSIIQSSLSVYV